MAHRIELYAAVAFLFLLLPINQSATIRPDPVEIQIENIVAEANDTLNYLEKVAADALRPGPGTHTIGCIKLPKEEELLNCSIIHTFSSYLEEASKLAMEEGNTELCNKLNIPRQLVEDLKDVTCGIHVAHICENKKPFNNKMNLEKLRSLLVLFSKWFSKPMA